MSIPIGVELEKNNALQDASDYLNERGQDLKILFNDEINVSRDIYGSIKKRIPIEYSLKGFPIYYSPTQDRMDKLGIRHTVDVIVTLATKDLTDNSLTYDDIDEVRWQIELNNKTYTIKDKNQVNHFADTYLNVVIGLNEV